MILTFTPSKARGTVAAPPSKSETHRHLICAALAGGESIIRNPARCDDTAATIDCLRALGVSIRDCGDHLTVTGTNGRFKAAAPLDCQKSASTLRFLLPLCLLAGQAVTLSGHPSLLARPHGAFSAMASGHGLSITASEDGITVMGPLTAGDYTVDASQSSQFASGMLLALPLCGGDSRLILTGEPVSRPYLHQTLSILKTYGIAVTPDGENAFRIVGRQTYRAADVTVTGDWSTAASLLAFNALGGAVTVSGLDPLADQADRMALTLFSRIARGNCPTVSIRDCPDLGPTLMALGALRHGIRLTDAERLRAKESDRLSAMADILAATGTTVTFCRDTVIVRRRWPSPTPPSSPLDCRGDHRIAMAAALLLSVTGGSLAGAEAVSKSDPQFFDRLATLGVIE